ncbi:MAG TPA: hypothetical protein VFT59_05980 [Candidatus Saccharimonadales bacterium]|nr:hypothetical protein [Candidatus Saccharimonadales bacterium]
MSELNKFEATVASWYKNAPHLPKNGQTWLANNVWWLALVGLILGGMAVLGTILFSFLMGAALVALGGPYGAVAGSVGILVTFVVLAFSIVSLVLMGLAIPGLKARVKKGWTLLFWVVLINVFALALDFLFTFNLLGLVWGLLAAGVGTYFLFEIRSYFGEQHTAKKPATAINK